MDIFQIFQLMSSFVDKKIGKVELALLEVLRGGRVGGGCMPSPLHKRASSPLSHPKSLSETSY